MRPYRPKDNVQKKAYYNDRFYVTPQIPKDDPASDEVYSKDIEKLQSKFSISESYIQRGELVIYIDSDSNVEVLEFLKDELDYSFLMEMSAVDFLAQRKGFEIFYELLSLSKRKRIRVKTFVKENQAIESVQHLFRSANFAEREMFDMGRVSNFRTNNISCLFSKYLINLIPLSELISLKWISFSKWIPFPIVRHQNSF